MGRKYILYSFIEDTFLWVAIIHGCSRIEKRMWITWKRVEECQLRFREVLRLLMWELAERNSIQCLTSRWPGEFWKNLKIKKQKLNWMPTKFDVYWQTRHQALIDWATTDLPHDEIINSFSDLNFPIHALWNGISNIRTIVLRKTHAH